MTYRLDILLEAEIVHKKEWANKLTIPRTSPNFVADESFVIQAQATKNATKVVAIPSQIIADRRQLNPNTDNTRWKTIITPKEPHKLEKDSYTFTVKATFENGQVLTENVTIHIGGEVQTNIHLTQ